MVFVGSSTGCWGHEITDHLKHWWFYFDERYAHLRKLTFIYTPLFLTQPSCNFFEMLKMLGIPTEQIQRIEKPTRFKKIHIPDECFFYDLKLNCIRYTQEYLNLINRLPILPPPQNKADKIYLSRTQTICWKDFNEIAVENFFKNQGFQIVYPEQKTFQENLALLQNCRIFAATDGSIGHNILFCRAAKQALILRKCRHFTQYQITANSLFHSQIYFIDAAFSPIANRRQGWWGGPFFLYESNRLRAFFHLKPKLFPFGQFLKFLYWHYFNFWRQFFKWSYLDHRFLGWTHPLRAQLKIGTQLQKIKNRYKNH